MSAPRAILYDRVSTVIQKNNYSGGKDGYQFDKCQAYCDARGWPVIGQISDVDSGAEWDIDGLLEAVERAKHREYDKLIVFETSRFARDVGKKAVYEGQLKRHGVQVVYLNLPEGDSDEVELMSDFMGGWDAFERKRIRKRVMHGIQQKAKSGQVVGAGSAPYGYQYVTAWSGTKAKDVPVGLALHPERARIVERIYTAAPMMSLADLAALLTTERIPTPTGKSPIWKPATLSHILGSRTYIGEWRYAGIVVPVPALVTREVWDEARLRLAERKVARRGRMPESDDEYLLRGMLRCGHCHGLIATWKASRWMHEAGVPREKTTSYLCLRHKPGRAARAGKETCPLPMLPASIAGAGDDPNGRLGIEDAARLWVDRNLLAPGALSAQLDRADALTGNAQRARERQVADLDAKIAQHRRRYERAVEEQTYVDRGTPKHRIMLDAEQREERMLVDLEASRATLVARPEPGLSDASRRRLAELVDALIARFDEPDPDDLRRLYREIRLRGTVTLDADGPLRLGHHRFTVAWAAVFTAEAGDSDKLTSEHWTLFSADGLTLTTITAGQAA